MAGRKRTRPELVKSDDECDDDELIYKLQARAFKEQIVDLDKMTRR